MRSRSDDPIRTVEPCTLATWQACFELAPVAATASPTWAGLWERASGGVYSPAPLRVEFRDGCEAILARTLQRTRHGIRRWHLSPGGTFGGWIAPDPLPESHTRALSGLIGAARSVVWLGPPEATRLAPRGSSLLTTHQWDLRDGMQAIWQRWTRSARQDFQSAHTTIMIREAHSWRDWNAYYDSYLEARRIWRAPSSTYARSFFRDLWEERSPLVRLFVAEEGEQIIGGSLFLVHGTLAIGWHAAQAPRRRGGSSLMWWEAASALAAEGIELIEFAPSGGHEGTERFKMHIGCVTATVPLLQRRDVLERAVSPVVRRVAEVGRRAGAVDPA